MKVKRRIRIIIVIAVIITTFTNFCICYGKQFFDKLDLAINWSINIPMPQNSTTIFAFDFKEGQDFKIWTLNEKSIKKIIKNPLWNEINNSNIKDINNKCLKFSNLLDEKEQEKYKSAVGMDVLNVKTGQYFLYKSQKNKPDNYIFLILDKDRNKVYYMLNIF
ncbi:hypothetical protein SAMN02745163_01397 [Clostridium cavendishii DSM 21758]|uniref:Uncharacterized protein n=1 Tax=Clostridium cavendishii DSM 21758 TaxID=1121302 RepID=A0A1M6GV19_9CLOT|nr:hypothetical protein [Clostridium cavendishii]SHJ13811.1 hypothetical protein SAMN02745163_01397 [Clostridium cavendishii DSM 21758]